MAAFVVCALGLSF